MNKKILGIVNELRECGHDVSDPVYIGMVRYVDCAQLFLKR